MAKKKGQKPVQTAVDFVNEYNQDVEGFNVELGLLIVPEGNHRTVIAGIQVMTSAGQPAFIGADILRELADEAEKMAEEAIANANRNR